MLIDREGLEKLLARFYTGIFLLLDGVISIDTVNKKIVAYKNVKKGDPILTGHLNGTVYPGLVSAEFFAQACVVLILKMAGKEIKGNPRLTWIRDISFTDEIHSGDQIKIFASLLEMNGKKFFFTGYLENQRGEKVLEIGLMKGRIFSNIFIEKARKKVKRFFK